jgi:DNA-directed RNA polymerase specialized sigma24 family protein
MEAQTMDRDQLDSTSDCEHLLVELDPYIQFSAWKALRAVSTKVPDMEIDELIQRIRIKLWQAMRRRAVQSPQAYIRAIAHNEVLQMLRGHRSISPLPLSADGELLEGTPLSIGTLAEDPAKQVERKDYLVEVVDAIVMLPTRQRNAMLMSLKDRVDNPLALSQACNARKIDLERINWPHEDKEASLRLRASVSVARKKLHNLLDRATRKEGNEQSISYYSEGQTRPL